MGEACSKCGKDYAKNDLDTLTKDRSNSKKDIVTYAGLLPG